MLLLSINPRKRISGSDHSMYSGPRMLMTRNLIYTAVTRARSCVCLVGRPDAFYTMADNSMEQKRYCGLKASIEEIYA